MDTCTLCHQPVTAPHNHHPDRARRPDHTVPVHPACHRQHHSERGDFAAGGRKTPTRGRRGYRLALAVCPRFHEMGGTERAKGQRDARGRFV